MRTWCVALSLLVTVGCGTDNLSEPEDSPHPPPSSSTGRHDVVVPSDGYRGRPGCPPTGSATGQADGEDVSIAPSEYGTPDPSPTAPPQGILTDPPEEPPCADP